MSTNQVWNINGHAYNWAQLQEMKEKGIDPKNATLQPVAKVEESTKVETEETALEASADVEVETKPVAEENASAKVITEAPEEAIQVPVIILEDGTSVDPSTMNFMKLKAYALSKGMPQTAGMKKKDILAYLSNL